MYVAARERRYLDALRGPAGQPVRYKRTGTTGLEPNPQTVIDIYEVTYDGLDKPVTIYVDAYHFDDALRAPLGFTCGAPIALIRRAGRFRAMDESVRLALEQGALRDYVPIPLGSDGTSDRGVGSIAFASSRGSRGLAVAAGKPMAFDPPTAVPDALRQRTVVVAYPLACEGRSIAPQTIDLVGPQGAPAHRQGDYASGESLKTLLPALEIPSGSIAASFNLEAPRPNDVVRITYSEPCAGVSDSRCDAVHPGAPRDEPMPSVPPLEWPPPPDPAPGSDRSRWRISRRRYWRAGRLMTRRSSYQGMDGRADEDQRRAHFDARHSDDHSAGGPLI